MKGLAMTKDELKTQVWRAIDQRADAVVGIGERIRKNPELGFKETKTAALVAETLSGLGLRPETGLAMTGVKAVAAGAKGSGPSFEVLGGKCELIRLGHFDDVDLAMMIHTTPRAEDGKACLSASNNGRFGKTARYVGRAAHAGGAPHMGINALYAAQIGLMAINAVRETFKDDDAIRVHPILTHGGSQVTVIPGEARIETYVRGRTIEGIRDASAKVDRALKAGALALGATVEIDTWPCYLPLTCDATMAGLFRDNAHALVGECRTAGHRAGCTDMGDVSQIMPVLHPYMGGATGTGHAADYRITDPAHAYVAPAKALAAMVVDLMWDDAAVARDVVAKAKPQLTRESYLTFQRSVKRHEVFQGGQH